MQDLRGLEPAIVGVFKALRSLLERDWSTQVVPEQLLQGLAPSIALIQCLNRHVLACQSSYVLLGLLLAGVIGGCLTGANPQHSQQSPGCGGLDVSVAPTLLRLLATTPGEGIIVLMPWLCAVDAS
eukprot:scaffold82429_cov46-Prasinocladus_malaysianus.AAC.1